MANHCCVCAIINTDPSDTRQASYSEFISHYLETELIPQETLIVLDDWLPETIHYHDVFWCFITKKKQSLPSCFPGYF
jgi:hypothetical protein